MESISEHHLGNLDIREVDEKELRVVGDNTAANLTDVRYDGVSMNSAKHVGVERRDVISNDAKIMKRKGKEEEQEEEEEEKKEEEKEEDGGVPSDYGLKEALAREYGGSQENLNHHYHYDDNEYDIIKKTYADDNKSDNNNNNCNNAVRNYNTPFVRNHRPYNNDVDNININSNNSNSLLASEEAVLKKRLLDHVHVIVMSLQPLIIA